MDTKPIYVTSPSLPPLEEFIPYLQEIWDSGILTNCGPMHQRLEEALCEYLGVPYISLFNNGTIALISALGVSDLSGEVITTPFSFIATTHSLMWNKLKPVFIDIDEKTYNIDPKKIEAAITPQTSAILGVHCYGSPCDIESIQNIADKHDLKVIYDAAHAFGVEVNDQSILNAGDLSILSFHATKVFNTFEGGAVISHDAATKKKIDCYKNFGIVDELNVEGVGINGKLSEINSTFGLVQLKHIDNMLFARKLIDEYYRAALEKLEGIKCLDFFGVSQCNYAYFPVLVKKPYELSRDELYEKLKESNIFARRYFHPLISDFDAYRGLSSSNSKNLSIATNRSEQVLCLPLSAQMTKDDAQRVIDVIKGK